METNEVIKKHEKRFNKVRLLVKILLIVLFASIIALQWNNIAHFLNGSSTVINKSMLMYKIIPSLAMLMATLILMSCQQQSKQNAASYIDTSKKAPVPDSIIKIALIEADLASKKDLVCGMPAFRFMKDTATFNKKIYAFCSTECKDEFLKNPKGYITKSTK